ncbi:Metal-dependent hydrolase, endonuclease/exonuclease/phosphatase family [Geodermatophilus telluris]|uniref:Metal-dependent hydrolase, endonuclease/exonuclease/phosphatase family n=1 Tax=Geodermatophilus telluris TaxID=1190417 RepID=A0A1G6PAP3_9ACTN|nr:endonuclease/exonuclease/phosphatase family protein [Geodermatophilus telluris]SDC77302.1 Metal-dependent hydrolase, endonuclease/exonuclease/phosphatase family [Geodermatophilus telluris]
MRIGTWNLKLCPTSSSDRGRAMAAWLDTQQADLWLLTEVHAAWHPHGAAFVTSPPRSHDGDESKRWAGIEARLPLTEVEPDDREHAGAEGLALARVDLDGTSVLVACSVLPWRGAGSYWRGLPDGQFHQFRSVLDHHVARISAERRTGEPVVWGGDLNQELLQPHWAGTHDGARTLRAAFEYLGLTPLTAGMAHLNGQSHAIDHLAVSSDVLADRVEVHRPTWPDGRDLSDHAAYTADVVLPRT